MIDQSQYKPRIFRQGLILILIPFSVVSAVLLLLTQLCINQEEISEHEQSQSVSLGNCMQTFNDWGEVSAHLIGRAFSDEVGVPRTGSPESMVRKLKAGFALIRELPATSSMPASTKKMEGMCMDSIAELMSLPKASSSDAMDNYVTLQKMPEIVRKLYVLPGKAKAILESEWKTLKVERKIQDKQAREVKRIAIACLIANLILSILLVWYFSKGITSRLRLLTENASHLPKLEKFVVKIGGNDELAYLGAVLEEASEKLMAAAEHRRAIFGMVAHDMRSPVTAGQLSLDLVQEALEQQAGGEKNDISIAQEKLNGTLQHVNGLLAVEQEQNQEAKPEAGGLPTQSNPVIEMLPPVGSVVLPKSRGTARNFLSAMFLSPGLFHRVLWLVLIPLLLQSVFVLFLVQQMQLNESLINEERGQSDITMRVNLMFLDSLKATVSELILLMSGEESIKDGVLRNFQQVDREVSDLASMLSDEEDERLSTLKSWRKLLHAYAKEVKAFHAGRQAAESAKVMSNLRTFKPLQKRAVKIRDRARRIFDQATLETQRLREQQQVARQRITQILSLGLLSNFVVSLLLFLAFSRDVTSRLKQVVKNAAELSSPDKPLPAPLPGKDELSYLDLILRHTREQLEQAAIGRAAMMDSIATDMQRPLKEAQTALKDFRAKQANLSERMNKQLSRAQHNIDRVLFLINDLLTMETLETGKVGLELNKCDLKSLAEEAIATVGSLAAEKKIELLNNCADALEICADKARLIQTIINYLSNAIKFSPAGSKIIVNTAVSGERVRVNVIDEGPGMDEETKKHVFERFFQAETTERQKGFGLGLAICTLIIESHSGTLGVESEPGKGSCFWFELQNSNPANSVRG